MKRFQLTEDHLLLMRRMHIGWDSCEFGAPAVDCKRPYGVDAKTVCIWIERGYLAAKKSTIGAGKNRRWRIEHEAIEAFIATCQPHYERRRVTDHYWRSLADRAHESFDLVPIWVAAKRLGCADETLKRRIRKGEMRAEQIPCGGGWAYYLKAADLEAFRYWHEPVPMVYAKGHIGAIRKALESPE